MKISGLAVVYGVFGLLPALAMAQGEAVGPAAVSDEARGVLKMLQERKGTLKDFVGKIDYSTKDRIGDVSGKRGTINFINDATRGPIFSADFTVNTVEGKAKQVYHTQFIFDGRELVIKDFGLDEKRKEFIRTNLLPAGAKPGDAATLNGALPLPIGLEVEDVVRNFAVTVVAGGGKEEKVVVLKLVPRVVGKFDYAALEVTVDKDKQLPVKLVETAKDETETTILLQELEINGGKAKMLSGDVTGWTERKG